MWDPNTLYDFGKIRQKELIERGQRSAKTHESESRLHWALTARREKRILEDRPPLEPAGLTVARRVISAMIHKLGSLVQARAATVTGTTRSHRGLR